MCTVRVRRRKDESSLLDAAKKRRVSHGERGQYVGWRERETMRGKCPDQTATAQRTRVVPLPVAPDTLGGVTVGDAPRFRVDAVGDAEVDAIRIDPRCPGSPEVDARSMSSHRPCIDDAPSSSSGGGARRIDRRCTRSMLVWFHPTVIFCSPCTDHINYTVCFRSVALLPI
jgi:hypothetical protein